MTIPIGEFVAAVREQYRSIEALDRQAALPQGATNYMRANLRALTINVLSNNCARPGQMMRWFKVAGRAVKPSPIPEPNSPAIQTGNSD